ncbi:sugar-transfer associated ATP-grasp domain-containing protein [Emticicia sp. 21SJ11W-3]|uniref:sugar-transfer associated ATP-grasp domain-containing protein n=1 Tax=Emticicia sp. 21SJ11W-3 TaxID=2916755 RepID=UPI00209C8E55|nr:sugar-transfer associated ATP-grasp domain-containing protein [Emticicia sp. 21SJ11W-3]UTA70398.1 hypothetical protein MB380_19045 [Emticicia sp. 21SJ11W-3]
MTMAKKAALKIPSVRTIGWDIALTPNDPTIIEGNDNWGKTIVELVTGQELQKKPVRKWQKKPLPNASGLTLNPKSA